MNMYSGQIIAAPPTLVAAERRRPLAPAKPNRYLLLIGPASLLLCWSFLSAAGWLDPRTLPAPWTAVSTGADLLREGQIQEKLAVSLARVATGFTLGGAAGLLLALLSALSPLGLYLIDGVVQLKRGVPVLAAIAFLLIWSGTTEPVTAAAIALAAFSPIYLLTHNALRTVDIRYVELAETLNLSRAQFIKAIVLPGALAGFVRGLRFGAAAAWLVLAAAEQVDAAGGIGDMLALASNDVQPDVIMVGLGIYGLLGLATDYGLRGFEQLLLASRRSFGQ